MATALPGCTAACAGESRLREKGPTGLGYNRVESEKIKLARQNNTPDTDTHMFGWVTVGFRVRFRITVVGKGVERDGRAYTNEGYGHHVENVSIFVQQFQTPVRYCDAEDSQYGGTG